MINNFLRCSKCNKDLPELEFRILKGKNPRGSKASGGKRFYWCIDCERDYRRNLAKNLKQKDYLLHIFRNKIKARHKKFHDLLVSFDDLENLWGQQAGLCYWTQIPMIRHLERRDALSVSVDRLDPGDGYSRGNIVLCCQFINVARQIQSPDEFKKYLNNFINFISPLVCAQESCRS